MGRYLIQSRSTGRFMAPGSDGQPAWFRSLNDASCGVLDDVENAVQIIEDHCDFDDEPMIIDLDKFGLPDKGDQRPDL